MKVKSHKTNEAREGEQISVASRAVPAARQGAGFSPGGSAAVRVMEPTEERWTSGYPEMIGHYDCKLEDGREEIVKCFPGGDSEIHPYMEILNCGIVAYRRIPGQTYRSPHNV